MKSIICILIYIGSFIGLFLAISLVGLVFSTDSYKEIIRNEGWIGVYSLFLGSWLAIFPTVEYHSNNKEYFKKHF